MSDNNIWEAMKINDMLVIDTIRKYGRDTIYFKDKDSKFIWNNYMHANQLGVIKPDELIGKSDKDFFPPEFAEKARQIELEIMRTGKPVLNIEEELGEDENVRYYSASKYPLYDMNNEIVGTWGISRDITEEKKLELELERSYHKMERLARVDDLSGLYNRRYFYELLEKYASLYEKRTDGSTFALLVADVDDITHINDQYGQQNGDIVLRSIAELCMANVRTEDTCFRTGGDEFAIVLLDTDKVSAIGIAKKLVEQIANEPIVLDGKREKVTISAGLAVFDPSNPDLTDLLSKAERKLNKSKREGKNKVSF
ncbi:MAG: GGDEF domain-containing protein [Saccharofermentans sp.]|jgi:diguanylate cyclase (GGDEF)-like protein/PAS domain S-box-containing protein|nr:GGDEF domain-containing protein [Clostridiales bacterium]MCR5383490.1 GGDEF domain-containing protein [Saccharofermentans sp.]